MKMTDFENFVLIMSSSVDSKFHITRDGNRKSLSCSADVGRHKETIKSCNAVFVFTEQTDKFLGIRIEIEKND